MPFNLYYFLLVTIPELIFRRQHLRIQNFQRFIKQLEKQNQQQQQQTKNPTKAMLTNKNL